MPYANRAVSKSMIAVLAGLLVGIACLPAMAQGTGKATMSVGITIVASAPAAESDAYESRGPRIPVDPRHAVDPADPLRNARVERVARVDGGTLQVVSY